MGDAERPNEARLFSCQRTPLGLLAAGLRGSARQASSDISPHVGGGSFVGGGAAFRPFYWGLLTFRPQGQMRAALALREQGPSSRTTVKKGRRPRLLRLGQRKSAPGR
jgi:hypothetical protein